jgi:hypothetical protein
MPGTLTINALKTPRTPKTTVFFRLGTPDTRSMVTWLLLFLALLFMYYGYHLTVRKGKGSPEEQGTEASCHLCRRKFPIKSMVARDKEAGFVNFFCADCIRHLYTDLNDGDSAR